MTEWMAADLIKRIKVEETPERYVDRRNAFDLAIRALGEIERYREIGTVEECREAMQKQKPVTPTYWGDGYDNEGNMVYDMYDCPHCGKSHEVDYDKHDHCPNCGQAIDWLDRLGKEV